MTPTAAGKSHQTDTDYAPPKQVVGPFKRCNTASQRLDIDELVQGLHDGRWPILGLRVTDAFAASGTGIVLPDGVGRAGHAVLLVGAARVTDDTLAPHLAEGDRLLCVRNSWGSDWGANGHKLVTETAIIQTFITAFVLDGDPDESGDA